MSESILRRVPVVGGLGYAERLRRLPETFSVTLQAEPENRYFRHAIAVLANGEKVGYVAPEVAAGVFEAVRAAAEPWRCGARRSARADHETSGVELLLDVSGLPHFAASA